MSIGRMDLNLLKVFDAVYEDRNLVLAGKRLHLTQSAVSHALARLRDLVGDELFMRTGKGMVPTGRATAVGGQEEGAVGGFILERGLARQSEMFDRQALEEALLAVSETPRPRVTVPHSLAIPALLHETDMLSIVPASLAMVLTKSCALLRRQPPYQAGTSTIRAVWHGRDEHDEGHTWMREMVARRARVAEEALGQ
jgi:DNA-binding transcriptional LysR family regulator